MSYLSQFGTFSKNPNAWGLPPDTVITSAHGCHITLNDGKSYLCWTSGLGSNIYGFCDPAFVSHVSKELATTGGSLSLPSHLESQVAEKLCHLLGNHTPGFDPDSISARFAKTGSDVTTMAVRLARAVTKRPYILTFKGHYHGWGDTFISRTDPAHGLLPMIKLGTETYDRTLWHRVYESDPYNFDMSCWYRWDEIAAVIFEVGIDEPPGGWYDYMRQVCDQTGTLMIVDEVVTGLRYGLGGACERYGIKPDLVCMGKALGNGLPVSALVGRREYMDWFGRVDPVFCSSTFWGESVGLAAADWVLENWTQEKAEHLWRIGGRLMAESAWPVVGHGARSLFSFSGDVDRAFFIQGLKQWGVLANRPNFPTLAHTDMEVTQTLHAIKEVTRDYELMGESEREMRVEGKLPRVLFRGR